MASRFAWFWMLFEPISFVVLMVTIREFLGRVSWIRNAEFVPWLIVGLSVFILFRDGVNRSLGAVEANQGLFSYRQVKPVDPVLVRNFLEGVLKLLVFVILVVGATIVGYDMFPDKFFHALLIWFLVWAFGTGVGLVVSVGSLLADEFDRFVRILMLPLFILSGVIVPLQIMPHSVQEYLLYNPLVHGIESVRLSFFESYQAPSNINLLYLLSWCLTSLVFGLALHIKLAARLRAM